MGSLRSVVGTRARVAALALLSLAWAGPAAAAAMFTGVGDLAGGTEFSQVFAVSADGSTAVGRSWSGTGLEAVLWSSASGLQSLGSLTTPYDLATGVSDDGTVISGFAASPLGGTEAFRWTAGTGMMGLGGLAGGALDAQALAMSGDGNTIVGHGDSASGQEAFRWTPALGIVGLGDLPGGGFASAAWGASLDGSVIAGWGTSANGIEAYVWTETTGMVPLGDLPGGTFESRALGLSADGTYVVGSATPGGGAVSEAFLWSAVDGMLPLGDLPGGDLNSTAFDVSADGQVVGGQGALTTNAAGDRAVVWVDGVPFDVKSLLEAEYGLDLGDWILKDVRGVSDDGLVWAGIGINPAGATEGWIASVPQLPALPVPEPPPLALLTASLVGGLWWARRSRSRG